MRLLSAAAEQLYARMLARESVPGTELANEITALAELLDAGLAAESAQHVVRAVAPAAALGRLLVRRQRESVQAQCRLLDDYERLSRLARPVMRPAGHPAFEVIRGGERVAVAAVELQATAAQYLRMLAMTPQTPVLPKVPCQIIFTPETAAGAAARGGRVLDRVPLRMQVIDGTALVMLTPSGHEAAVVVREPVIVAALVDYFDLLWDKAIMVPEGSDVDDALGLSALQRTIMSLLLRGMTDATVSKVLGISTRSVRRQVAALEERAGVDSRFALGAAAVRLGWLDT
ncbi:MAG TPA: hypothetical protein VFC19_36635 [Candidatus Limnocylindrales bacterium]|nr:hypothetical protein [Candidatus Limnocylindrales bacterium]